MSIFENVIFTICGIPTLHDFLVTRRNPLVDDIRRLDVSFVLQTELYPGNRDPPNDPEQVWHKPEIDMWASIRARIGTMRSLLESYIWIDCFDDRCFSIILTAPIFFSISPPLQSRVIFNLPAQDDQLIDQLQREGTQISRRDKPEFHGCVSGRDEVTRGFWLPLFLAEVMATPRPRGIFFGR